MYAGDDEHKFLMLMKKKIISIVVTNMYASAEGDNGDGDSRR